MKAVAEALDEVFAALVRHGLVGLVVVDGPALVVARPPEVEAIARFDMRLHAIGAPLQLDAQRPIAHLAVGIRVIAPPHEFTEERRVQADTAALRVVAMRAVVERRAPRTRVCASWIWRWIWIWI